MSHFINFRDAVRRSFFAKIAVWLVNEPSRNIAEFSVLTLSNGQVQYSYLHPLTQLVTSYLIDIKQRGEPLSYPGINIRFLNEIDRSDDRVKNKMYLLPVSVVLAYPLSGNRKPSSVAFELMDIEKRIGECLSDGFLDIWDFASSPANPSFTGHRAFWNRNARYDWADESVAVDGGDIRHSLSMSILYHDLSF